MKDKKVIAYKNERSKKIAYNLRKLLRKAVMQEWSRLGREQKNKPTVEYVKIENERSDLYRALGTSICECPSCNQIERDMMYNAYIGGWYCTSCVQGFRDYYHEEKTILDKENMEFYESFLG